MRMFRGRRVLFLVVAATAVITAALLFLFRDPLVRSVSLPLAWILWLFRTASVVLGQRIVWALFVLIFAAVALQSLRAARSAAPGSRSPLRGEGARTRIAHWESALALDQGSSAARHVLVLELRRLALSVLAHTEGGDTKALEQRMASGETDVPACVRELFGQTYTEEIRRKGRPVRVPLIRLPVAEIVGALEARLGVTQADAGRKE